MNNEHETCYIRIPFTIDGGVNLAPDLMQKVGIVRNAVAAAHKLGNKKPRVAVLSAVETVQPALASSVDAATIAGMNREKKLPGCVVDGPLAIDFERRFVDVDVDRSPPDVLLRAGRYGVRWSTDTLPQRGAVDVCSR